ncbi:glycine cleavage system protein GcvH [Yinghuangia sp. ASG 101]|uniref:glycine cleavage system protein GcvH n=1 Tax=Yinghuangia sp. ASG 101 TaxID=2896848 RepID=UPI001E57440A|nr:glycine cleavage system protein GcvH [Yinghuangia sp. ASG 101]UGQ14199.1 glycine cleavage system protein GcvH [Yinghuangia sp. ASG 101]
MSAPRNLLFSKDHEWLTTDTSPAVVGISKHAADALGDVVFVQLPEVGARVTAGEPCGELESTKSVSDLFAPANGEVVEVNAAVAADPSLVNSDPYGDGWLIKVHLDTPAAETDGLMSEAEYDAFTGA